jgi:hypothetical protein
MIKLERKKNVKKKNQDDIFFKKILALLHI